MRIAMVSPYSLSRPGGVQGQVMGLGHALRELGHDVSVVAPDDQRPVGEIAPDGTYVVGRSTGIRTNGSVAPVALLPSVAFRAGRFVAEGSFDVVHLHEPMTPIVPYGCILAARSPIVATFHRSGGTAWYTALRPLARWAARRLEVRCAVSDAARATAQAALGGEYRVLFNGVNVARFANAVPYPTEGPTVLYVGRHEERKGLGVLLDAFASVPEPATLWVASEGPQTERLRAAHPPSPRVQWIGELPEDELAARMAAADVLCAPSLFGESFGMVVLEGLAAGCIVVASDLEGYRVAGGAHALLVPPGDFPALAAGLTTALFEAVSRTGRAAASARLSVRRHVEEWSLEHLALAYTDIYKEACSSWTPPGDR
jgi:phosphatidyl-myo-inositol alpha-mannosyltransferase